MNDDFLKLQDYNKRLLTKINEDEAQIQGLRNQLAAHSMNNNHLLKELDRYKKAFIWALNFFLEGSEAHKKFKAFLGDSNE